MLVSFSFLASFFSFEIFTVKLKMKLIKLLSLYGRGTCGRGFCRAFSLVFRRDQNVFWEVMLLASSAYHNDDENKKISKEKRWTCSTLFGTFLCHLCTTNIVKLHWNGNAIIALICKIVASSKAVVATSMSSEIPMHTEAHYSFCWLSIRPKIFKTV